MKHLKFAVIDNYGFETRFDKENIGMKLVIREKNEHTLQVNLKDITSNLIGIWHFEQDTKDESGYNNHAILNGGEFINAKIGYGIQLDGIDDHLVIGNKYNFANREPFTISFWVKPNTIKNGWMRIFSKEEYNNGRQGWLIFQDPDGRIGFERWRDDIGGGVLSNKIIDTKEFTHIACIYDGNKISI
ncbi:MAG: LamG domain-containing protein, partial [Candidatus Nitrosothermus koennekii]